MSLNALIAALPEDTIIRAVESFGAQEHHRSDRHIWFTTVCHGGDSHKLCYNRENKTFYCYTNCGFMDFPQFLQHVLGGSFQEVVGYLKSMRRVGFLPSLDESDNTELEELERIARLIHGNGEAAFQFQELETHVLECFEDDVFYEGWLNEGISAEAMQAFGIRWDEITKSVIIPHYDINGQLVGVRSRQIDATKAKYMPLMMGGEVFNHPLGMNLYGVHLHRAAIEHSRQAIVVEAEKSVMKHHTWFGDKSNAVAVCGFNISEEQRKLLMRMNVEEVVLAFDKDVDMAVTEEMITSEYERYCETVNRMGRLLAPYCRVTALVDMEDRLSLKDSPMDQGKDVFLELMKRRQEIIC